MAVSPRYFVGAAFATMLGSLAGAILPASPAMSETSPVRPSAGALDPFLPKDGAIKGNVVTFEVSPADRDISARFRRAVQGNMDFFQKAVRSNTPGAPLPFDDKMGITREEYDRLEHMTPAVKQGEAVTVAVARDADGTVRLKPVGSGAAALDGISFPPGGKTAVTPVGTLSIVNELHQADASQPLGAFDGVEWAQVAPADGDMPSAKLGVGRRRADGGGLLYFQVAPYKDHAEQSLVVFYALK